MSMESTQRFSNRVENYVKYRPSYPRDAIDFLYSELGFNKNSIIADIGSGTGIFTKLLLERGSHVIAVEPNPEMKQAGDNHLNRHDRFMSISGTAEATQIESGSVDFIVSAQAYHWFDRKMAKVEFARILRPHGTVVIIWNNRHTDQTIFDRSYENLLLTFGKDYQQVNHTNIAESDLREFFKGGHYIKRVFGNHQDFDFDGLKGRLLSSSYTPSPDEPNHYEMIGELAHIFNQYNENGKVAIRYDTEIYYGKV